MIIQHTVQLKTLLSIAILHDAPSPFLFFILYHWGTGNLYFISYTQICFSFIVIKHEEMNNMKGRPLRKFQLMVRSIDML